MPAQPVAQIGIPTRPFDVEAAPGCYFSLSLREVGNSESGDVQYFKIESRMRALPSGALNARAPVQLVSY